MFMGGKIDEYRWVTGTPDTYGYAPGAKSPSSRVAGDAPLWY